jgi:hypothetical protein
VNWELEAVLSCLGMLVVFGVVMWAGAEEDA